MEPGSGELQCVGRLEIAAAKKPLGFLCGTLPVPTDAPPLSHSALLPSPQHAVGAPRYQMLPAETDLNTLPVLSNFREKVFPAINKAGDGASDLHFESNSITQNLSKKCEALAVSGLVEYGDEIDVVAPTAVLKQIFKIPYSKAQLSIAVHRIGDTLILNTGPGFEEGEKMFRRQSHQSTKGSNPSIFLNFAMHSVRAEACDCPPPRHPSTEKQSGSTILPGHFGHREGPYVSSANAHVCQPQYIDKSASQKSSEGNHDELYWGTKHNKQKHRRPDPTKRTSQVGEKPRFPVQESEKYKRAGNNGFLRILFWQFHNFRMLLGSDLLLFSNEKYVAVSLHLWHVSRQVTPLTWLEAWLDNVMASVPELAICYHQDGVVQGYELLKTDDIFLVKGVSDDGTPAFHPQIVQQNGLSVLRFLQDNCKQDPGAYWLYKSAGEDVIQLFDLSVIPKSHSVDDHDKSSSSFLSLMHKGRTESLFSLGTLLYRVAHRLSLSKAPDNRARCAKFFKKCLDFLSEQEHLVVRAYAHEQFARLILKCYEELDLTPESVLLESEVTVTDLEDESSEVSLGMFGSLAHDNVSSQTAEEATSTKDGMMLQSSDALGTSQVEDSSLTPKITISGSTEVKDVMESATTCKTNDSLVMCQMSETIPQVVRTVADPISSKLAAIHHVSQAIKSLRWKRQLQNTGDDIIDHGNIVHERSSTVDFSLCACGDACCIEVCDIREWLAKSKIDQKLWNLVLLLGESYLALGEAYKEDGQLHQALKVVEVACLVYGSMPQQLDDARFISSMTSSPLCQLKSKYDTEKETAVMDSKKELGSKFFEECSSTNEFSSNYLFWAKTWTLVGDVYVEYYGRRGKETLMQESKRPGSELRLSNEVVREVKRLKKKLGQYQQNCSTCSLANCSCQSDRASSGSSASSSNGNVSSSHGRKQVRKSNTRNSLHSIFGSTQDDSSSHKVESISGDGHLPKNKSSHMSLAGTDRLKGSSAASDVIENENTMKKQTTSSKEAVSTEPCSKDASRPRQGGIFKFLDGPKAGDAEDNLLAALACYDSAMKALDVHPNGSIELHSIFKKKGWVCNELGRYRLENRNSAGAEAAFVEAIKAFKEVSDSTNIILINCNLGHGRRQVAEELVSKMDELKKYDLLHHAYKQTFKTAKLEYLESLRYYRAAKTELMSVGDGVDSLLCNEVYTQYAHTYLRLGMLLAREGICESHESVTVDELSSDVKMKEQRKHEMSASDAFREALSTYESLGELRKQETAFAHFQLACYHRDSCMKFLDLDQKQVKHAKWENHFRQRAKWYASLAEKNWQKSIAFYGPKTHPVMYLNILLEQSTLSLSLSSVFHSNTMLEAALVHILEGRHVVEANADGLYDLDSEIITKFWNQLQALLKSMLAASLSGSSNKSGAMGHVVPSIKAGDAGKLKEMYRISLKSIELVQLHAIHQIWNS